MQVDIIIDERKLNQIQRMFATWPGRAKKIFKESINRTIEKMRTRVVSELNQLTGMKKKHIRDYLLLRRASLSDLTGRLDVGGGRIPVRKLGFKRGRSKTIRLLTSQSQAAWLYENVFTKQYGDSAVFASNRYRIKRKIYPDMTYMKNGQRVHVPTGSFWTTLRGRYSSVFQNPGGVDLQEVKGPSMGQILTVNPTVLDRIKTDAGKILNKELDNRVARFLKAQRVRGAA